MMFGVTLNIRTLCWRKIGFPYLSDHKAHTRAVILISSVGAFPGVIGADVPWLDCPAYNALTWVITVTEKTCMVLL